MNPCFTFVAMGSLGKPGGGAAFLPFEESSFAIGINLPVKRVAHCEEWKARCLYIEGSSFILKLALTSLNLLINADRRCLCTA